MAINQNPSIFSGLFGNTPTSTPPIQRPPITQQGPSALSNALNSPLVAALISGGAGFLQQSGANAQNDANRQQTAAQFNANMAQRQLENSQADQRARALSAQQVSPLGTEQNYAAKMALAKKLLGGLSDVHSTPGDPAVASAMGSRSGGMHLPQFSPNELENLFGDYTTQSSLAQHAKQVGQINPSGPTFDLASIYGNSGDGSQNAFMTDVRASNQQSLDKQMNESAETRQLIQQAMAEDAQTGKPGGSSIWKKIAKIGLIAGGGIATALTAGAASPLLPIAIGAGTGAASGALDGGGKGALLGGLLGGVTAGVMPGGAAGGVKATGMKAVTSGLKKAAVPALSSALTMGRR